MKQKDIFYIVVSSFILVVFWIGFQLWHIQNTSKINEAVTLQSTPISPTFDTKTLEKLKQRDQVLPVFALKTASPTATVIPTRTPTPTITAVPTTTVVEIAPTP